MGVNTLLPNVDSPAVDTNYPHMNHSHHCSGPIKTFVLLAALISPMVCSANKKPPTSKLYVADLEGQSEIDTGERIEELAKKSVHNAQGTVIQTHEGSTNAMVFSNGIGVYLDQETRMEVKRFVQEPFSPNRTDLEVEPSLSQTQAFIPRGTVGLCAPRMVAGSSTVYSTPEAALSIRGKKVVIEANAQETIVSSVEGGVTIRSGANDKGGQVLESGQQAIIRRTPGQPISIDIHPIPDEERQGIEDKVTLACNARRTVYFDVAKKPDDALDLSEDSTELGVDSGDENSDEDLSAGAAGNGEALGTGWGNVFDNDGTGQSGTPVIVPIQITPAPPIPETAVSASAISKPKV